MRLPGLAETSAHGDLAAFSPDGRRVAIVDSQNAATRIWDVERGRETAVLVWGRNAAGNVAFSPDGARLVTTAGAVRIWDAGDEPDPARLVHAPGARAPQPLNRLSASELQRHACALLDASHRARRFSSREFRTALAINESLPQDVCDAPRHWERVLAAHGRNVSDFRGFAASVWNIGGVRVTYRYEGVVEGVSALWIADGTGRAARRDDLRVHGLEESRIDTYWNSARTYIRADGQPVATLPQLPFDFLQRHIPQPAPAEEANVLPRDLSAGYRRIGERTIMGRRCTL
jgi:hypothetical protein